MKLLPGNDPLEPAQESEIGRKKLERLLKELEPPNLLSICTGALELP